MPAYAPASGDPLSRFRRSRISLPVLKNGTLFWSTGTCAPVRGLRPARAGRCFTENAPKTRNSHQRRDDLIENRVHDVLDIPLIEMRVVLGDTLNEFGFDHRDLDPGTWGF